MEILIIYANLGVMLLSWGFTLAMLIPKGILSGILYRLKRKGFLKKL